METKSRVIKYAEKRQQISQMKSYSFDSKALPDNAAHKVSEKNDNDTKNTLVLSAEELLDQYESYSSSLERKEVKSKYNKKKKKNRFLIHFSLTTLIWSLVALLIVALIVIIVLVVNGVL